MALGVLSREAIERAIAEYDELGRDAFLSKHGFGRATAYALVVDGREYDPKAIAGVAYGIDHPEEGTLRNTEFNGGQQLRSAFRPAGYDVVLRTPADSVVIRELLGRFMAGYVDARSQQFRGDNPASLLLKEIAQHLDMSTPVTARPDVKVEWSVGRGNWAAAPWIAFLDQRVTTTTLSGVYAVLLFREDMSGVYLAVAQGTQELKRQGRQHMLSQLSVAASRVVSHGTDEVEARGFAVNNELHLGEGTLARDYAASVIVHKLYLPDRLPTDAELLEDLEAAMSLADADVAQPGMQPHAGGIEVFGDVVAAFRDSVESSGLRISPGHGERTRPFVSALVTKPFVILSGMSGSGKTQLALRLGEWFGEGSRGRRFLPVAVRPDWTGPEALFGYEDALRPAVDGRAAWFVPATLDFLLRATAEPDMPYLLLLDEMNLAHVERYFSDFLSGIESRDLVLPNLSRGRDGEWRLVDEAEPLIPLPKNLFVVGTVNVDETTYQFSPKVLDRATTFEVRTQTFELDEGVRRPTAIESGAVAHLRTLVNLVVDDTWQGSSTLRPSVAQALRRLHQILTTSDDEFGHRVFYESLRFAAALEAAGVTERDDVLDHIVITKVLPRVHGSRRKAEPVLRVLQDFAVEPDPATPGADSQENEPRLPITAAKIRRMLRSLEINQYVTFTD